MTTDEKGAERMASYAVNLIYETPILIRWASPYVYTFDPSVEGEWRESPEKASMFWRQGDFNWYDDISDEEAEKYMEQIREAYRKKEMMQMEKTNQQPLLQKAIEFAAKKHACQPRKGTSIPYITHVIEAMEIVSRITEDEEIRAAAVLHDTLEDTCTTKKELVQVFGPRVADLVASESEDKREDQPAEETWLIRKLETIEHLSKASTEIRMIALGDKLSNIRAMYRDYQVIGEELWKKFNNPNPKEQGMYYTRLAEAFGKDEMIRETPAYREYVKLCSEIFGKDREGVDE